MNQKKTVAVIFGGQSSEHEVSRTSVMLMLNIPDKYAMERGGWKTPYVMHEVYQHTFSKERQNVDAVINRYFEDIV